MKSPLSTAFCRMDLLFLVAVSALLGSLVVAGSQHNQYQAKEAGCVFNLRSLAGASFAWASDHNNKLPWHVPGKAPGILPEDGSAGHANVSSHFYVMRKEIGHPATLRCPSDVSRSPASGWDRSESSTNSLATRHNNAISYFVATHGRTPQDYTPLFGDRHLTGYSIGNCDVIGVQAFSLNVTQKLTWGSFMHGPQSGNIVMADGSVIITPPNSLQDLIRNSHLKDVNSNLHVLPPI